MAQGGVLNGETAFRLYDTYGFPLDLTQDALRARGLSVDTDGFNAAMERQRADARRAWSGSGEAATETIWYALRERVGATEFLGYETETAEGVISAIVKDGVEVETLNAGERGSLILNQTPFYGESGGQVGDVGEITASGFRAEVTDTRKKLGDLVVHDVTIVEGAASLGLAVELQVNHDARTATRANHSATHILHEALRIVLGDHVAQKGSLVSPERLRFDIAHPKPITRAELEKVEDIANHVVLENAEVTTRLMGLDDARASGARALFGEKYGDEVRVVTMGEIEDAEDHERTYSIELCGGTHVHRTGDIGLITIVGESAVAAGVRRIEAKTRDEARKRLEADSRAYADLAALLRAPAGEATERLEALIDDKRKLERELADAKRKLAMGGGGATETNAARDVAGVKLYARAVSGDRHEGPEVARRRSQAERRLRRGGDRGGERGRQGEHRRRRHARSHEPLQRGRSGAPRLRRARRQGRRRAPGHGAGRRPGRREDARGAGGGRRGRAPGGGGVRRSDRRRHSPPGFGTGEAIQRSSGASHPGSPRRPVGLLAMTILARSRPTPSPSSGSGRPCRESPRSRATSGRGRQEAQDPWS